MYSQKYHHTIETSIKATNNETNEEIAQTKPPKCCNLSKEEQKTIKYLHERDDIVTVTDNKGRTVIIMDASD